MPWVAREAPDWVEAPARFLGNISFALYLTHRMSYEMALAIAGGSPLLPLVFLVLAIGAACVCYWGVELPALRLLLGRKTSNAAAPELNPPVTLEHQR